eukprot:g1677.t1
MSASPGRPLTPSRAKRTKGFVSADTSAPAEPPLAGSPRKRERGVYSEAQAPARPGAQLGVPFDTSTSVPPLAFDAAQAEYAEDLSKSVADLGARFPDGAVNPKVQISFSPRPGGTPREIAVRRKRRQYAKNSLPQLLAARGVRYDVGTAPATSMMPPGVAAVAAESEAWAFALRNFDDEEYEEQSVEAWLRRGEEGGAMRGLPALGLCWYEGDGTRQEHGEWAPCVVTGFDAGRQLWSVTWDEEERVGGGRQRRAH